MHNCDFLIIGSGIAGLMSALKLAQHNPTKKIVIITKEEAHDSNTQYAQGGLAVVLDKINDSYEQHIEDTLNSGDGLCIYDVVKKVITDGPKRVQELIDWGVKFDKNKTGHFDLNLEGGHTQNRIMHNKDNTGYTIAKTLLACVKKIPTIELLTHHFAIDLITQHHVLNKGIISPNKTCCYGAYVFNKMTQHIEVYAAKITLLASGGSGQIYRTTTNPSIATGDGVAMAYRAKAQIRDMEFIQFHPTALYDSSTHQPFLISEVVRGFGALLRNGNNELFMEKYDSRKELASRDIVSRAIDSEMKKRGDDCMYIDYRNLNLDIYKKTPNIVKKCKEIGINIKKDLIPVVPAAHYFCGGIVVDINGQTTVENLMACGECANTGLHGANRLASNSLLEALVFAHQCCMVCVDKINTISFPSSIPSWNAEGTTHPKELVLITHNKQELQATMSNYVGIVCSNERLDRASKRLKILYDETEILYQKTHAYPQLFELRNLITVAYFVVQQSKNRQKNKGVFYNIDIAK